MKSTSKIICSIVTVSVLGGCQKQPTDVAEPKSYQYYLQHAEETKEVAAKCNQFEQNELSTLPPSKQMAWRETPAGINCTNAVTAKGLLAIAELQRRREEAAKNVR